MKRVFAYAAVLGIVGGVAVSAHAADAYIQSDGVNTVNLGYYAGRKTKIEVDFQFTELMENHDVVFGHYNNDFTFLLYAPLANSRTFKFSAKDGNYSGVELSPQVAIDLARHTAVIDMPNRRVAMYAPDGTEQGSATLPDTWTADKTSNWPLLLFGSSSNASGKSLSGRSAQVRIYGARIYEAENGAERPVHDLVPCLKGENAGFHDNVTGVFFGGQDAGAGALVAGGDGIKTVQEDGYIESPADNKASKHLTFNTGYYMKANSWLAVDYQWLGTPADLLFGAWDAGAKLTTAFWIQHNTVNFGFLYNPNGGASSFKSIERDNYRHTAIIDARDGSFRLLNRSGFVQWSGSSGTGGGVNDAAWPIVLFGAASDANGTGKQFSYARIFSAKFYEGDDPNPVKEFVPYVKDDGTAGFLETVSGVFTATSGMSYGGAVNGRTDAYVESAGTTCLNLGYKANMESRIEVDFLSLGTYGKCLCGAWTSGNLRYTFWNANLAAANGKWSFIFHGKNATGTQFHTDLDEDTERRTAVMDMKNRRVSVVTGGVTNWTQVAAADTFNASDESSCPMGLFGYISNTDGTGYAMPSKARIYSVRIYEDDVLKHEFLPCRDGDATSLYDTVDKTCAARVKSTDPWPILGGKGVEGAEKWLVEPQDATVGVSKSVTLKALAAGAVSYRWTRNGEAVAGGADGELDVEWRASETPDVYAVTPVYSILGSEVEGDAVATATVENLARGLVISIW